MHLGVAFSLVIAVLLGLLDSSSQTLSPDVEAKAGTAKPIRDFSSFNDKIDWIDFKDFQTLDLSTNTKPICFVITHPEWSPCEILKYSFVQRGKQLEKISNFFLMVSIDGVDSEGLDKKFQPDGGYFPRILFADPIGKLRPELGRAMKPHGDEKYKYLYTSAMQIYIAMKDHYRLLVADQVAEQIAQARDDKSDL